MKTLKPALAACLALLAAGCVSLGPVVTPVAQREAQLLGRLSQAAGLENPQTANAAQLVAQGQRLLEEDELAAYLSFDTARLVLRLNLARERLAASERELARAETALKEAAGELRIYQDLLNRLKIPIVESNL